MKCYKTTLQVKSGVCQGTYMTGYCAPDGDTVNALTHVCVNELTSARRSNPVAHAHAHASLRLFPFFVSILHFACMHLRLSSCGTQVGDAVLEIASSYVNLHPNLEGACNITFVNEGARCGLPRARQDYRCFISDGGRMLECRMFRANSFMMKVNVQHSCVSLDCVHLHARRTTCVSA